MTKRTTSTSKQGSEAAPRTSRAGERLLIIGAVIVAVVMVGWFALRSPALSVPVLDAGVDLDPEVVALVDRYVALAQANPRDHEAHGRLGMVYEGNSQWEKAAECFANAAQLNTNGGLWKLHYAITTRQAGEVELALDLLAELADEHPNFAAVQHRYGHALVENGMLDEAMRVFLLASTLEPSSPAPYIGQGDVLIRQRRFDDAVAKLNLALAINSSVRSARYLRGLALRGQGREELAAVDLAVGADGRTMFMGDELTAETQRYAVNLAAQLDRAANLIEAGQPDTAAVILERAIKARPENVLVMNNLAAAYKGMNQLERAEAILLRAWDLDNTEFATCINLSGVYLAMGRDQDALAQADKAIGIDDNIARSHYLRARALANLKQYEVAAVSLERCIRLDVANPEAYVALGEMYFVLGRRQNSVELLQKSLRNYQIAVRYLPDWLPVHVSMCSLYMTLGDLAGAEKAIATARALAPTHPRVVELQERLLRRAAATTTTPPGSTQ